MKVAMCQTNIIWEDKEKNIEKCVEFIEQAKKHNIELMLFPEMSFTGFSMNINNTKENYNYTVQKISKIARENKIAIGFGWVEEMGHKARKKYTVVNSEGNVLADYAKIHPFSYSGEDKYFVSGASLSKFKFDNFTIGLLICYDLRFPEIFQALSKECDAIVVAANWPASRKKHWKTLLKARAIENQVYIFAINCVGKVGDLRYSGDSCIINPNGDVLSSLSKVEGMVIGDITNDVKQYRSDFPTRKDRIPEFYKTLF